MNWFCPPAPSILNLRSLAVGFDVQTKSLAKSRDLRDLRETILITSHMTTPKGYVFFRSRYFLSIISGMVFPRAWQLVSFSDSVGDPVAGLGHASWSEVFASVGGMRSMQNIGRNFSGSIRLVEGKEEGLHVVHLSLRRC